MSSIVFSHRTNKKQTQPMQEAANPCSGASRFPLNGMREMGAWSISEILRRQHILLRCAATQDWRMTHDA